MTSLRIDRLLDFLTGPQMVWGALWLGLVLVTIALMALMVTRWGQSRPLGKCVALSLLTHALLATYAMTIEIVASAPHEAVVRATIIDEPPDAEPPDARSQESSGREDRKPWERMPDSPTATHDTPLERMETAAAETERMAAELPSLAEEMPAEALIESEPSRPAPDTPDTAEDRTLGEDAASAEPIEAPAAMRREAAKDPAVAAELGPQREASERALSPVAPPVSNAGLPDALKSETPQLPRIADMTSSLPQAASAPRLANVPARTSSPLAPEKETTASENAGAMPQRTGDASGIRSIVGRGLPDDAETRLGEALARSNGGVALPKLAPRRADEGQESLPSMYQLRRAPKHAEIAERQGGSAATEAAVQSALKWLAANQHADGRWDASHHGAGRELKVGGQDRSGAGAESDTGVTGLALLAFLGAGNTHLDGEYHDTVARGVAFLLDSQAADGNLGGRAERFAFMYCHGMAALALSEVFAMTGDERLEEPVRLAIAYTLGAQSRSSGGWRYGINDSAGDTSQLGWQLMALKSAEMAGIPMPAESRLGMIKFLKSVSSGRHGGLASYRAGERPTASMTAEALVCRQFLGLARSNPASDEAGNFVLTELPGHGKPNFYYWYYATLGMFQLQGDHWRRWNDALAGTLVARQRTSGPLAGSWDDDDVWGGHGGRVYTTAMGALCLEVYYRFLPLYVKASALEKDGLERGDK